MSLRSPSEAHSICPSGIIHAFEKDLPLTFVGVALLSPEEAHSFVIFDILRTIHDVDHFALGADGLTGIDVFRLAVQRFWATLITMP